MDWNEKQTALITLLADLSDGRTKEAKAEACGFSGKHVYRLLANPDFANAVTEQVRRTLGVDLVAVFRRLVQQAVDGDVKASELLLKASGWIPTGGQTNVVSVRNVQNTQEDGLTFAERLKGNFEERMERAEFPRRGESRPLDVEDDEGC